MHRNRFIPVRYEEPGPKLNADKQKEKGAKTARKATAQERALLVIAPEEEIDGRC